jgi:hypothetical protein
MNLLHVPNLMNGKASLSGEKDNAMGVSAVKGTTLRSVLTAGGQMAVLTRVKNVRQDGSRRWISS